jgi:hypothetical protein
LYIATCTSLLVHRDLYIQEYQYYSVPSVVPTILCIFLCRNSFKDGTEGKILSLVDFPVENFKPNEHLGINEATDNTTYDLVASVNHNTQPNNGGHYTAICQQHESDR